MKSTSLLSNLQFREAGPHAEPLYVDQYGRAILFTLKPGQSIKGHEVPQSPFYVVVLKGHGFFGSAGGEERRFGPNDLLVFDPGEKHHVRAEDEELVFVGFLHGAPGNTSDRTGGDIGRSES